MVSDFLNEPDVTINSLSQVLDSAYIEIDSVEDDTINIFLNIFLVQTSVNEDKKCIQFLSFFKLPESVSVAIASEKINVFNRNLDFGSFYFDKEDDINYIAGKYSFSYKKGLIPFQFVEYLRVFDKKFTEAARLIHKIQEDCLDL